MWAGRAGICCSWSARSRGSPGWSATTSVRHGKLFLILIHTLLCSIRTQSQPKYSNKSKGITFCFNSVSHCLSQSLACYMEDRDVPVATFCDQSTSMTFFVSPDEANLDTLISVWIPKHKLIAFDPLCKVLGVQIDLRQSGDLLCRVSNTEERVEELIKEIDDVLTSKHLARAEGERLRGRLQFASSQVFGSKFKRLLTVRSNHLT